MKLSQLYLKKTMLLKDKNESLEYMLSERQNTQTHAPGRQIYPG